MKGLLIKDFMLLKSMKRSFIIFIALSVMYMMMDMGDFAVPFCGLLSMFLFSGTVSYDQLDNGLSFMFTMPFTKKQYVLEKYLLCIIGFVGGLIFGFVIQMIGIMAGITSSDPSELLMTAIVSVIVFGVLTAVYLPVQMKYGAEKSRIVIFVFFAIAAIIGVAMSRIVPADIVASVDGFLDNLTAGSVIAIGYPVTVVILVISILIAMKIMDNKEC